MKYLHLRITMDAKGVIYEKDVAVRNVFESFLHSWVSSLVRGGTLHQGEHYAAIVIPRYGETLRRSGLLSIDAERVAQKTDWIEMQFEEPVEPDRPVRYFTIELRVRERNLIYRQDFQTFDIGRYFINYGIERALIQLGLVASGEYYYPTFFARDDDQAQFDKERMPALERQAASLIELVSDQPAPLAFPFRDTSVYGTVIPVGSPAPSDIQIYLRSALKHELDAEIRRSDVLQVELGGILVGQVYENTAGGRRIVEISDLIPSKHTVSSITELRYTFESWQSSSAQLRSQFPGKRIVGWYHTHLIEMAVYTDEKRQQIEHTTMFFSRDDVFLHKQFFADEWYVAMVLDLVGKSIFFQWKVGEIVAAGGYHIFEDVGIAEAA